MLNVQICAVGRMKSGPEADLFHDYTSRFGKSGRALGFGPIDLREVEDRKGGGMTAEADLLRRAIPAGAVKVMLDERGQLMPSPKFADRLARWRDAGQGDVAFVIGGADGIDPALRAEADLALSFGQMVWPHMLARVMLAEQLYRAVSILGGAPYHRA